jgi:hypothetical protein
MKYRDLERYFVKTLRAGTAFECAAGHSFYIHDPFGNKLEIKGPAEYPDGRATVST